jgi:FkbM family methyltransferase
MMSIVQRETHSGPFQEVSRNSALRYWLASQLSTGIGRRLSHSQLLGRRSWAQEGEDLALARLLEPRRTGFYVDIGAHDPFRYSNTAMFYGAGWSGLNIEPDPEGASLLRRYRERDITLNIGVGATNSEMIFFRFEEPAFNTFDAELAQRRVEAGSAALRERINVPVDRLENILARELDPKQRIDFMTVDAEGLDLDVLMSNDWERFRPDYVLAEALDLDLAATVEDPLCRYMMANSYKLVAKIGNSVIFASLDLR